MHVLKRIISYLMIFAIIISSLCVPAYAAESSPSYDTSDFYGWAVRPGGSFAGDRLFGGSGRPGYEEYVSTLPATGLTSGGKLKFVVPVTYSSLHYDRYEYQYCSHTDKSSSDWRPFLIDLNEDTHVYTLTCADGSDRLYNGSIIIGYHYDITFPVSGFYSKNYSELSAYENNSSGTRYDRSIASYSESGLGTHYSAGSTYSTTVSAEILNYPAVFAYATPPSEFYYLVTPDTAIDTGEGGQYNISTRPTSITGGNYGIVGDDGIINTVTNNNQIINETNNTYYNPATDKTSNITDWSYNYEDRSYTLTLEGGDTTTVTYGDENISITENNVVEGDTIVNNYTIYYMVDKPVDPGPSTSTDPAPSVSVCAHTWTETSRTDPDCISPGSVSSTCSNCGETKTETLKAKGHTWQVERTVQTSYDEQGNLIQQGYTIYQCAVCGEQYKDDTGAGPPGGPAPDDFDGISDLVTSIFEALPNLFNRFLNFLGVVFPYLPPELTLLLTFGVVAVVFIGIIKAIRR